MQQLRSNQLVTKDSYAMEKKRLDTPPPLAVLHQQQEEMPKEDPLLKNDGVEENDDSDEREVCSLFFRTFGRGWRNETLCSALLAGLNYDSSRRDMDE